MCILYKGNGNSISSKLSLFNRSSYQNRYQKRNEETKNNTNRNREGRILIISFKYYF